MKKIDYRKLHVASETIRVLQRSLNDADLRVVVGGGIFSPRDVPTGICTYGCSNGCDID
jgi:hypothetical protein